MSKNRKLYGCVLAAAIIGAVLCVHLFNQTPDISATPPSVDVEPPGQNKAGELLVGISSVIEVPAVDRGSPPVPPPSAVAAKDEGEMAPDATARQPDQSLAAPDWHQLKATGRLPGLREFRKNRAVLLAEIGKLLEATKEAPAAERTKQIAAWRESNAARLSEDDKRALFFQEASLDHYQEIVAQQMVHPADVRPNAPPIPTNAVPSQSP